MVMSDLPHSDADELQALLTGESALSRRYRELSKEQPPAHVDAAILAASHSALASDARRSVSRWGSMWSRVSLMRWSVPLATAAVVIVAATLTLTMQRDPEIDRLYDKYDKPAADMRDISGTTSADQTEVASSAKGERETVPTTQQLPASARVPAASSVQEQERALQKDQPRSNATSKRSDQLRHELAASRSAERDAPASEITKIEANASAEKKVSGDSKFVADEQRTGQAHILAEEQVADAAKPAEAFARSDDAPAVSEPADVASASAETSDDAVAIAGAPASPQPRNATEAEELMNTTIATPPSRRQRSALRSEREPVVMQQFADQDVSGRVAQAETRRDPAVWIAEIEKLLAEGKRDKAIASVEKFVRDYPDYQLPENLKPLVRSRSE
jgi:hypothetical protein